MAVVDKDGKLVQLWGNAFSEAPLASVIEFCAGRDIAGTAPAEQNLICYDICCNRAHATMLGKQGIIPQKDAETLLAGLAELEKLCQENKLQFDPTKEDVHTFVESWLIARYGMEVGGKLHTARSRNDQVACDMRLYLRDQSDLFRTKTTELTRTLKSLALQYKDDIIPGFTHHQHAMVTSFGHLLMGFAAMTLRDVQRFSNWRKIYNSNPLGSAAGFGTSYPIDRELTKELLGFDRVGYNSFDDVGTRGEAETELGYNIVMLMQHLSKIAQTIIILCTPEFGMITLADKFSTGSSIMPQKKNPDPLEVIKAKTAYVAGQLQALIGIGNSSFIGYNRDTQWTKYLIMDIVRECIDAPQIMVELLSSMVVNKPALENWAKKSFIGATSLLEQLANYAHIPFRQAKFIVEKAIKYSDDRNNIAPQALDQALAEENIAIHITADLVTTWQDPAYILKHTPSAGGPSTLPATATQIEAELLRALPQLKST